MYYIRSYFMHIQTPSEERLQLFASRCQNIILHITSSKYRQVEEQIQQYPTLRAMICFPRYGI